jgi:hypothetical protein
VSSHVAHGVPNATVGSIARCILYRLALVRGSVSAEDYHRRWSRRLKYKQESAILVAEIFANAFHCGGGRSSDATIAEGADDGDHSPITGAPDYGWTNELKASMGAQTTPKTLVAVAGTGYNRVSKGVGRYIKHLRDVS